MKRVILCSGKHYYALDAYRKANNIQNVAIIRIEVSTIIIAAIFVCIHCLCVSSSDITFLNTAALSFPMRSISSGVQQI